MKILFTGGFTLGSVTPLLAVAEALNLEFRMKNEELEMLWIGTRKGPERKLVEEAGIKFSWIWAPKLRRYFDLRTLFLPLALLLVTKLAGLKLLRLRPDVIVTAGGFAGVPVVWAAWWMRIFGRRVPVLLHNQDVRWSLANKLAAPVAKRITYALPGTVPKRWQKKAVWTGNPVRSFVLKGNRERGLKICEFNGQLSTIMIVGGGTGAKRLNEIAWEALPELTKKYNVIHLTGKGKTSSFRHSESQHQSESSVPGRLREESHTLPSAQGEISRSSRDSLEMTKIPHRYCAFEFMTKEIADLYAAADLVVTRAGMGLLSELAALGKPAIIVPIPGSHQEDNARYFAKKRAATILDQRKLTGISLAKAVDKLIGELGTLQEMSKCALELSKPDAAKRVAEDILTLANK